MWHFAGTTLRNGAPLPRAGDMSKTIKDIALCVRGWHASERAIDALAYAPGPYVARVALHGTAVAHGNPIDKYVGQRRENLTDYIDVTSALRATARYFALEVAHLWAIPADVRSYLESGDESLRAAARDAEETVAWHAVACTAARAAAWAAADDVAWDVDNARQAAGAARRVAGAAAWDVADAAWAAARAAARDVAGAVESARRAAENARRAAGAAAWDAARADAAGADAAAREKQNEILEAQLIPVLPSAS